MEEWNANARGVYHVQMGYGWGRGPNEFSACGSAWANGGRVMELDERTAAIFAPSSTRDCDESTDGLIGAEGAEVSGNESSAIEWTTGTRARRWGADSDTRHVRGGLKVL